MESANVHTLPTETDFLKPASEVAGGKQFMDSPEMEDIAEKVIKEKDIELGPASVWYLLVYPNISKKRAAKAKKASPELTHATGYHYLIEISGDLWDMLDEDTKYMVVWNQLLHLDPQFKAKQQEWKMQIRKPDYTDYYEIADNKGSTWHKTVQATMSSLHDLDPRQENQVSLF